MIYLSFFDIDERVIKASEKAMELCKDKLAEIDNIQEDNRQNILIGEAVSRSVRIIMIISRAT